MTADCAFSSENVGGGAFLYFSAGEFTINGHGHSIIGPTSTWTIYVQNAGTVLDLNNVTIQGNTGTTAVTVTGGARLSGRRVTFRDNMTSGPALLVSNSGEAHFEDAQFLENNASPDSLVHASDGSIVITNGLFAKNSASSNQLIKVETTGSFSGSSLTFSDNSARTVLNVDGSSTQATLQNVLFLNNIQTLHPMGLRRGSAVTNLANAVTTITNGIFRGNQNVDQSVYSGPTVILYSGATVNTGSIQLQGCMTFEGNARADGSVTAVNYRALEGSTPLTGKITDSSTGRCPAGIGFISWLRSKKKPKEAEPQPTATSTPRPAYGASYVALQTATGMTFEATYGLDSGVHFRQLDGAGIGIQSIIDAGYLAALDVYGYVEQGVEVCFPQAGRVIFLDAQTMPRAIVPLESTVRNGMTCVSINSPGSLVLLPN